MKNKHLVFSIFLMTGLSLFSQIPPTKPQNSVSYKTTSYNTAVFNAAYSKNYYDSTFTPSEDQIDKAEKALSRDLRKLNKDLEHQNPRSPIDRILMKYNRQYFGYINEDNHKILYINALHRDNDSTYIDQFFHKKITKIYGGISFWNVSYNITENYLFDFNINSKLEE